MAKSTRILCNADALSRAAEAIATSDRHLSKNAVLKMLATAIAGPGHDWGKLKNAPDGQFAQPGLAPATTAPQADMAADGCWLIFFDERDDWSRAHDIYETREDALAGIASLRSVWQSEDHPFETVMSALEMSDTYHFDDPETLLGDPDDDDDDYQPAQLRLCFFDGFSGHEDREYTDLRSLWPNLTRAQFLPMWAGFSLEQLATHFSTSPEEISAKALELGLIKLEEQPQPAPYDTVVIYNEGRDYLLCERDDLTRTLERFGSYEGDPRSEIHSLSDIDLWVEFRPRAWVNGNLVKVDPHGETIWKFDPDDHARSPGFEFNYQVHITGSANAPQWVRHWTGPFDIKIWVEPKKSKQG